MAKLNPLEDPPTASSSDDEEVESSSRKQEETEEQISDDSSSEEAESKNPLTKKSIAVTVATPPVVKSGKKRPAGNTSKELNFKRAKKVPGSVPLFQRVWTEEDEILLLQGMIDFKSNTGKSPYEDKTGFYEIVKKSISFEASKNQFMDKIRSLKNKYIGKLKTGLGFFSMGHDKECMKLAKIIWGSDVIPHESAIKKNLKALEANCKKVVDVEEKEKEVLVSDSRKPDWFDESFVVRLIKSLGVDEHFVKQRWSKVGMESKKMFEEKWKVLQGKEMELVLEKTEFMREVMKKM